MNTKALRFHLASLAVLTFAGSGAAQCIESKLRTSPPIENNWLGEIIDVDGGTVVAAATGNSETEQQAGAAYVFEYGPQGFEEVAVFYPPQPQILGRFARDVAVDGEWIMVCSDDHEFGFSTGAVFVYQRTAGGWSFSQKLTSNTPTHAQFFGSSVAIDGERAVIGARGNSLELGGAYIFELADGLWQQVDEVTPVVPGTTYNFGHDVAISGDRVLIGTAFDDPGHGHTGAAYLFEKQGGSWSQMARLVGHDSGFTDVYGQTVALDGDTAVVSGWGHGAAPNTGAAYVFERNGTDWPEIEKLESSQPNGSRFGFSVDVQGDRIAIGCRSSGGWFFSQSSAEVFRRTEQSWESEFFRWGPSNIVGIGYGEAIGLWGDSLLVGNSTGDNSAWMPGEVEFLDLPRVSSGSYCSSTPNSTGRPAELELLCPGLEDGRLPVRAAPVPNSFGVLLHGDMQVALPMGDGLRCVGGSVYRSKVVTASGDELSFELELGGPGSESVLPGTTWNFQALFHEPDPPAGGSSFNLSDAVSVTLAP